MTTRRQEAALYKQCIALAGLFQAAALVEELATKGTLAPQPFAVSIGSIFKQSASSVEDVFEGQVNFIPGLALGFATLRQIGQQQMGARNARATRDLLRYVLAMLHLQGKLQRSPELLSIIDSRLQQVKAKLAHHPATEDLILANLAGIYEDTLGTFRQRIQVTGNRLYLENPTNINKVRAVLLAGIRAAMLWRQVGGSRWRLLLHRNQLLEMAKSLSA